MQLELHGFSHPPRVHVLASHVVDELLRPLEDEDRDPGGRQCGGQRTPGDAGSDDRDRRLIRIHDGSKGRKWPEEADYLLKPPVFRLTSVVHAFEYRRSVRAVHDPTESQVAVVRVGARHQVDRVARHGDLQSADVGDKRLSAFDVGSRVAVGAMVRPGGLQQLPAGGLVGLVPGRGVRGYNRSNIHVSSPPCGHRQSSGSVGGALRSRLRPGRRDRSASKSTTLPRGVDRRGSAPSWTRDLPFSRPPLGGGRRPSPRHTHRRHAAADSR